MKYPRSADPDQTQRDATELLIIALDATTNTDIHQRDRADSGSLLWHADDGQLAGFSFEMHADGRGFMITDTRDDELIGRGRISENGGVLACALEAADESWIVDILDVADQLRAVGVFDFVHARHPDGRRIKRSDL
jgi:hypothetical protein